MPGWSLVAERQICTCEFSNRAAYWWMKPMDGADGWSRWIALVATVFILHNF
jgi:hypothetical protein